MSTMALILFVLILLSYVRSLISAKRIEAFQRQIDTAQQQLRALNAEIQTSRSQLDLSRAKLQEQQAVIADSDRQLDTLRTQLQSIAVLRVGVLNKLKQAIETQLGANRPDGSELVTIGDNGNIVINESLVFEYNSYAIKVEGRPLLDTLARALGAVLDDADARANIDTIIIQGHTDERGSDSLNWDLSARRATAVVEYLFEANKPLRDSYGRYFSASAYSKYRPINPGTFEAAYQQNRRIEISIIPRDDNVRKVIDEYVQSVRPALPTPSANP
jgi:chemotaxis protein MotB